MRPLVVIEEPRSYRNFDSGEDLKSFRVTVETSDLFVKALHPLEAQTEALILQCRSLIEQSIELRLEFLKSLIPIQAHPEDSVVACRMIQASSKAGVGPMAAVAGAVAEYVGRGLMTHSDEVLIENGGDLFIFAKRKIVVGIYAGSSPFSNKIGLRIDSTPIPLGISTSSGRVGPSKSFGKADAATIVSSDPILADAVATATANRIIRHSDLASACQWAISIEGVRGCLTIMDDKMAALGDIELIAVN